MKKYDLYEDAYALGLAGHTGVYLASDVLAERAELLSLVNKISSHCWSEDFCEHCNGNDEAVRQLIARLQI